ncbi:DUF1289 domain-containing protein [Xenorhabdus szentirmaii]|uniref:Oxidoreductase n=2 Tax=Xenorhabdus szentirmaii TaxID=290112 RepID=W1IQP2_9GAMM|nr:MULTISPECIES: DUF1289 domain-containing protein [Xenorhabdus]MBD2780320.1 DUF1289 domain-containing protein [Xenorhabdus sp. 38]MBD2793375.1 DUF1289 domain-containing protein [Xenorhabdus sp. CUL]MBD2802658.1 DUF1289 domain-containing protein [Xenorhabdus sp. M]MBD2804586.1 DUF1289 domain-containing protein [Xenorhabdus sp. ZM]MBD2819617.1 DUF1289 domain-containing protein [Xenorhabdus sp. 42]
MTEQLEFFAIPNPCRGICESDSRGFCRGCYRSREERFMWMKLSDSEKRNIFRLCHQRYLRSLKLNEGDENNMPNQPDLF